MNIRICAVILVTGLSSGLLNADSLNHTVTTSIGAGEPATFLMLLLAVVALVVLARCAAP